MSNFDLIFDQQKESR